MGRLTVRPAAAILSATSAILIVACGGEPRLVKISERNWYVDDLPPGKTANRLYHDAGDGPVLVDREVERYRVWANGLCLMYEAARPEGRIIFSVTGRLTPIAVTTTDALRPWRLDIEALRRFDGPVEMDQRTLLTVQRIDYSDICYAAQLQPPRDENWAQQVRVGSRHFDVHESVVDVHGADSVGNSVLSDAAREGQIAMVDELIRAGADVNSASQYGVSVLMTAIPYRHAEIVRRLLQAGALVNAQDNGGGTALMTAAHYRNPEIAKILLEAGANATIRDNLGRSALSRVPDGDAAELRELRILLKRAEDAAQ